MLPHRLLLNKVIKNTKIIRNTSNLVQESKEKWEILCGVCLERKPVISRTMNKLETSFMNMLKEMELENSMKSDHEMRHEADLRRAKELAKGKVSTDNADQSLMQTALEFEDNCKKELAEFTPAPRITPADEKNDVKSTERKLDQHLLYIINTKIGNEPVWIVPHDNVKENENLKTAAERIIREKCGETVKAKLISSAPCGFYKYRYPNPVKEKLNATGAKIFFMKAQYLGGNVEENKVQNYNWATRNELQDRFVNKYYNSVRAFLMDDEPVDIE